MKTDESNFSDCDESIESDIENEDSQFCESEEGNQQEDRYEIENDSCDSEYEFEEVCSSNRGVDCHSENECYDDSDFLDYCTNVSATMSSSYHPDNNHI